VHKRFMRWANSGVWERVFHALVSDKKNSKKASRAEL
jgi:transposase